MRVHTRPEGSGDVEQTRLEAEMVQEEHGAGMHTTVIEGGARRRRNGRSDWRRATARGRRRWKVRRWEGAWGRKVKFMG